jgi:hypothetical protein
MEIDLKAVISMVHELKTRIVKLEASAGRMKHLQRQVNDIQNTVHGNDINKIKGVEKMICEITKEMAENKA